MPAPRRHSATLALLLAAVIVLTAALGVTVALAAGQDAGVDYPLDDTTHLSTQEGIQTYDETGVVHANVSTPQLTVTVADSASECGLETSMVSDTRNSYLCLDYQEDVDATIRIHVSGDYWHPYVRETKASIRGTAPASFQPTEDGNATAVTVDLDGATKAVYPVPRDVTASYYVLEHADSRSESILGFGFRGHSTSWQTIDSGAFSGENTSTRLMNEEGQLLLQYDATPNQSESTWFAVPSEPGNAPVYRMTRSGEPNATYVVSTTTDAPPVRYKSVSGASQQIDAAMRQIGNVQEKVQYWIDNTLDRFLGGDD
jgi:hypothetical protein